MKKIINSDIHFKYIYITWIYILKVLDILKCLNDTLKFVEHERYTIPNVTIK